MRTAGGPAQPPPGLPASAPPPTRRALLLSITSNIHAVRRPRGVHLLHCTGPVYWGVLLLAWKLCPPRRRLSRQQHELLSWFCCIMTIAFAQQGNPLLNMPSIARCRHHLQNSRVAARLYLKNSSAPSTSLSNICSVSVRPPRASQAASQRTVES